MSYKGKILNICLLIIFSTALHSADRKLNILFCVKSFPTKGSWFILNQITEFINDGHQITILTRDSGDLSAIDSHPDIKLYNLQNKTFQNYLPENLRSFDIILCQFSSLAPYVIKFIEKYNIKGKLFIFIRGAFCYRYEKHKKKREKIFKKATLFLGVCKFSKNQIIKLGCDPQKVAVVHSTIDCDKFSFKKVLPPKDIIKIITICRLTKQKGIESAIQAVNELLKIYPNCEYKIIGEGILREKLEQLIHTLHLEKNIILEGWKKPDEIKHILEESHIFLHPSITQKNGTSEGIPTAIMEAMAIGIPVVSTYHAGIPELIKDGISGFLAPENDIKTLTEKIIYLIKYPKIWRKIRKSARRAIKKNHDKVIENKRFIELCKKYLQ